MSSDSPFIGKYVCFGLPDGSFSWGRIKHEGVINTMDGEKDVFILTDRMTCRVPRNKLEMQSVSSLSKRIGPGNGGPVALPGRTDPSTLPDYQKAGYGSKMLPKNASGKSSLPVPCSSVPEATGVPELSDTMNMEKSKGLRMFQKVVSSQSGLNYVFRKYGYDTLVQQDQLNLEEGGDIIDREITDMDDLTDDELFLLVMRRKLSNMDGFNLGVQNMLKIGAIPVDEKAVSVLKKRKGVKAE